MNKRLGFTLILVVVLLSAAAGLATPPALALLAAPRVHTPTEALACRLEYLRGSGPVCVSASGAAYLPTTRVGGPPPAVAPLDQPGRKMPLPDSWEAATSLQTRKDRTWRQGLGRPYGPASFPVLVRD